MNAADALDARAIRVALPPGIGAAVTELAVHARIDSTSAALLRAPAPGPGAFTVSLAEYQSEGVGRNGARWESPEGGGLWLSVGFRMAARADLSGLSLAMGVATVDALAEAGVDGVQLKWPNDLIHDDAKLGGILVQSRSTTGGGVHVVVGIGINVQRSPQALSGNALPATSLARIVGPGVPARNALAATLLSELVDAVARYAEQGFAPFVAHWRAIDWLRGKPVQVFAGGAPQAGIARGVAADGALQLDTGTRVVRIVSGTVRLAGAAGP